MCRWVLGLDKAHIASAPLHLRLPWKLSPGHAFISDGGFLSAGQTSGWNYSDHCGRCCWNLARSSIFSALFSNNWILNFLHLHSRSARTSQGGFQQIFLSLTLHKGLCVCHIYLPQILKRVMLLGCPGAAGTAWSSLTALRRGILLCVFRLESRMWGFGNPLSQPCLSDDRNPI